jgi:hypothetical protein
VRRRRHEQHVPRLIGRQSVDQLVPLVLVPLVITQWPRHAVRLIDDHQIRRGTKERIACRSALRKSMLAIRCGQCS